MKKLNKKGFTIIELIVCLGVLAIITTSVTIAINEVMKSQKEKEYEEYINKIESSACTYADLNDLRSNCENSEEECVTNIKKDLLIMTGLLEEGLKNPNENKIESDVVEVKWTEYGEKICTYVEGDKK